MVMSIHDVEALPNSTKTTLTVESMSTQGSKFSGQWIELWQNNTIVKENFTPFSAVVDNYTQYQVYVYDDPTENKFFDHWDDGTTLRLRNVSANENTTLYAFFNFTTANVSPGGVNDVVLTQKDQSVIIDVLANDTDLNYDPLFISGITMLPQNGTTTITPNNTITYVPKTGFVGHDTFDYEISDRNGGVDTANVYLTINGTITSPTHVSLAVKSVDMFGTEFSGQWVELWQNGRIIQENFSPLTVTVDLANQYDIYVYDDPAENKFFDHWDDNSTTRIKTILPSQNSTLTAFFKVIPVNVLPVVGNDTALTSEDVPVIIDVLANDSDPDGDHLSVNSTVAPMRGSAAVNSNGTITYYPNQNISGSDSFRYVVSDGRGGISTGNVFVGITPVDDSPIVEDDADTYVGSTPTTIDVLANDSDVDGDVISVLQVTAPQNGTATINSDGTITYAPNQNFADSDSLSYTVTTGNKTSHASIHLTRISLDKLVSGLVAFDPLNNATLTKVQLKNDTQYWRYGGSAVNVFEPDAPFDFFQNSTGRYVGVQSPSDGLYAGFFGVTPQTQATLFHSVITTPVRTIPNNFFQNGLYVQTWDGRINYVTCVSITGTSGTTWHVIRTFGNFTQATQFEVLWSDLSTNQPLTRDCTIITNGNNYLKVYLGGVKVYENHSIDLQMPSPFLYFIEPQNSHSGSMLYGAYRDYYATKGEALTVSNLPSSASEVQLVDNTNATIGVALVNATSRSANIDIGKFHFPILANIRVVNANGTEIISSNGLQEIYGGDVYGITYPSVWTPEIGTSWNVQLREPVVQTFDVNMYAIDVFDNDKSIVDSFHTNGTKVICYVNAGSWESWRTDASLFPEYIKGNDLVGFAGEKWLDLRQLDVLGPIMQKRLDLCKQMGFDGVDPDNVESYRQDTGFPITYADQLRYNHWLADEAHKRGLSIGLKNDLGQITDLLTTFDWGTNEQCGKFNECDYLKPFIAYGKPVFHIEYVESGQTADKFCPESIGNKFDGILKSVNLTAWFEPCKISNSTSILRVLTELNNGTNINGFFVTVNFNQTIKNGFSPTTIEVPSGHPITIQVSNFGNFVFDHWKDDDDLLTNKRNVFLIDDSDFIAVYRNTN